MYKFILLLIGIASIWAGITYSKDSIKYPMGSKWATTLQIVGGIIVGISIVLMGSTKAVVWEPAGLVKIK